jgi:hypothetical protein
MMAALRFLGRAAEGLVFLLGCCTLGLVALALACWVAVADECSRADRP